jgi:hypothetical protein
MISREAQSELSEATQIRLVLEGKGARGGRGNAWLIQELRFVFLHRRTLSRDHRSGVRILLTAFL